MSSHPKLKEWLEVSFRRALPFLIFLSLYTIGIVTAFALWRHLPESLATALIAFSVGASLAAVWAGWKFALAFSPDADFATQSLGYFDVEDIVDPRALGEQLLTYRRHLRTVALTYERQRQNLTRVAIAIALALASIPIITWCYVLARAFDPTSHPNAWLAVFSASTTGGIGLAIAVTILRHLKATQRPFAEVQERMFDAIEAGIAVNAADLPKDLQLLALQNVLTTLSNLRSRQLQPHQDEGPDADKSLLANLVTAGIQNLTKGA